MSAVCQFVILPICQFASSPTRQCVCASVLVSVNSAVKVRTHMKMSSGNQEAMSTKAAVNSVNVDEDKAPSMHMHSTSSSAPGSIASSYHVKTVAILVAIVLCSGSLGFADGLKCHMCGQYNEGVGSITPCTNYTTDIAHLYLKECTKKSEKFCVVSPSFNPKDLKISASSIYCIAKKLEFSIKISS